MAITTKTQPLKFAFVLTEGFTFVCLAGFIEVLRTFCDQGTNLSSDYCRWTILADTEARSSSGILIGTTGEMDDPADFDFIVVIGGKRPRQGPRLKQRTVRFLRRAARANVKLIGVTAGTFELARLGLLDGHHVCVHWDHLREFNIEFPEIPAVSDRIFIVDRERTTCAGGTYVIDLAVHLLALHFGHAEVRTTMSLMGIHDIRQPSHYQKQLLRSNSTANEMRINRLIRMIETRTEIPPSVAEMAEWLRVSQRHLERILKETLGITPLQFSAVLRLRRAQWLVRNSGKSLAEVAYECGFSDASHLIRLFKREFSVTPNEMRKAAAASHTREMLRSSLRRWEDV